MFHLEPISTTNIFSLVQIIVVLAGFIFSWRSLEATRASIAIASQSLTTASKNLELTTSNAQAQLYNQMVVQGRDLQYKFMDLYLDNKTEEDRRKRRDQFTGTVLSYYSACYGLRKILDLPTSMTKLLDDELKQLMKVDFFKKKWSEISDNFSKEFIDHVGQLSKFRHQLA